MVDSEKGALTAQYALGKQVAPPMSYEVSLPGTMKAMMSSLAELAERQAAAEGVIVTSYVVRRSISCEDPDFEQIELDIYADETAERALVFWDRLGGSIDRWKVDLKPADRELLDAKVSVQVLWR